MSTNPAVWESLTWSFGDRIRKIRRAVGIGQGEFAAALDETRESVSAWESGRVAQPRNVVAVAKRIELAYGVSAGWTLGIQENPRPGDPDGGSSLPRLDSNQQPFDSLDGVVIPMFATKIAA